MLRSRFLAVTLVAALAVAGCVAPDATDPAASDADAALPEFVDPMGHDHDHSDPALHDFVWGDWDLLAHHPLGGSPSASSGAHALDVRNGHLFVATYGDVVGADGGFFVFDVSNPEDPQLVGRHRWAGAMGGDRSMEATPDGDFVVLGTEPVDCAGHVNPFGPGIHLVDVRDKSSPMLVDYFPTTGTHAVATHDIGGETYAFTVSSPGGIFRINKDAPPGLMLEQVADLGIGHDMFLMDDPLLNTTLLYAADGSGPLNVYDVGDPANPMLVGKWNIPDRGDDYYVHTVVAEVTPEGRRIVVVSSEDWLDYASPLWVLDATDFEFVETLATWTNPGGHGADGLRYSLHNPRIDNGTLYVAHYHGGVWTIDLTTPEEPKEIGYYLPHESGTMVAPARTSAVSDGVCGAFNLGDAPIAFDVEYHDGVLYVADLHTGLYALRPPA